MSLTIPPGVSLSEIPALQPPPGVTPNFTNPESQAHGVMIANGIITAVMLVFVLLRVYTKAFLTKTLFWEDAACIAGTVMSVGYLGLLAHVFQPGRLGPHQWNVRLTVLLNDSYIKELKAVNFLYGPMMTFTKLSILLLYFRLFSPTKTIRIWIYVGIVTTLLNHVVGTIIAITICLPSDAVGYSRCSGRLHPLDVVINAINILSDFYILVLPLFVISKLHMQRAKKFGVSAVFLTGFLACVSSIAGLAYRIKTWKSEDISWWIGPMLLCSLTEINIGLIVGCMPVLPVLFQHEKGLKFVGKYFSSLRSDIHSLRNILRTKRSSDDEKESHLRAPPPELGLHHPLKDSGSSFASTPKEDGKLAHDETSCYEPVTMV
ncbi:hypothetical protein EPUS_09506 [Endocarpon pusillum Z07020]|uniref:Rhodopsin domain-containing protein n=1 Tax=Endocarpon pusillum (strain Z07020 / HMAS-L-300199) TaxID=1263415 RepID=U1HJ39_ENDPU|nr:uncharacterized protein EPUS_09506 [Endocarpon pusillum Z07020]ERF68929.1 hypothetical protein EPUS_09506 [Endocarpon pusillum Z07020]